MLGHRLFFQLFEPFQHGIDDIQKLLEKRTLDTQGVEKLHQDLAELQSVALFIGVPEAGALLSSIKRYHAIYLDAADTDYDPVLLTQSLYNLKRYFNYLLSRKKRLPIWLIDVVNQINSQAGFDEVKEYQFFDYNRSTVELAGKWHKDAKVVTYLGKRTRVMMQRVSRLYQLSAKSYIEGKEPEASLDKMSYCVAYIDKALKPTAFSMLTNIASLAIQSAQSEPTVYQAVQRKEIFEQFGGFFVQLFDNKNVAGQPNFDKLALEKEVIKPFLYLVSLAHPSSPGVIELRKQFSFPNHALPSVLTQAESKRLSKPDGGILLSAAEMIDKELLVIRDKLDIVIRQGEDEPFNKERSVEIVEQLDNISKTLRMLEMDKEGARLHITLQTFNTQNLYSAESLENLMVEVLQLEASLKEFKRSNTPIQHLPKLVSFVAGVTDLDDAKLLILINIKDSLTKVERIIEKMLLADDYDYDKWAEVAKHLHEQRGALRFLQMGLLAKVLEKAQTQIEKKLKEGFNLTKKEKYELIDLIAKVDLFVSSYVDKKPVDESFVINSDMNLEQLP